DVPDAGREKQRVEIARVRHLEPRAPHELAQPGKAVTPAMMTQLVVAAPQPHERRHGQEQHAARAHLFAQRGERSPVVGHVLQDVERSDQVEREPVERQPRGQRPGFHARDAACGRTQARLRVAFHGENLAVAGEHAEIAAAAAADLEDAPARSTAGMTLQNRGQYRAPRREPPMLVLASRRGEVQVGVHEVASPGCSWVTDSTTYGGRLRASSRMRSRYSLMMPMENSSIAPTSASNPA